MNPIKMRSPWARAAACMSLAGAVALTACSGPAPEPEASSPQSSRWPAAEQTTSDDLVAEALEAPAVSGQDTPGEAVVYDDLCETLARPVLTDYLSDVGDDDAWRETMLAWPGGSELDLTRRPTADDLVEITEMPGEGASEVWCEAVSNNSMWLVGISWPTGEPAITTIQSSTPSEAFHEG